MIASIAVVQDHAAKGYRISQNEHGGGSSGSEFRKAWRIKTVMDASQPLRLPGLGACIYCDDRFRNGEELSDEHVVPEALGGKLILENASCANCAKETSKIERLIAQAMLDPFRIQFGVQSKRKKRQAARTRNVFAKIKGKWVVHPLSIKEFPVIVQLPALEEPRILARRVADRKVHKFRVFGSERPKEIDDLRDSLGATRLNIPAAVFINAAFGALLLKIAHSFAATQRNKFPGFRDVVPQSVFQAVRDDFPEDHLVGGFFGPLESSAQRHELFCEITQANGRRFLTVVVRLFGDLGFPAYRVVTGIGGTPRQQRLFKRLRPLRRANPRERRACPQLGWGDWDFMCGKCDALVTSGCKGNFSSPAYCSNCGWLSMPLAEDRSYAVTDADRSNQPLGTNFDDHSFDLSRVAIFGVPNGIISHYVSISADDDGQPFDYRSAAQDQEGHAPLA
ncbi:HNH endonuclease [Sphingomonas kyeonggiensis]|uniref:HNH endonuclease n=1 Tax=Sphingomonas kyeonggiensis TaxID=1268553 RepID=UPI0027D83AEE|nr:HNH endonuclease [Sphingomonas kyeonggiensis]